MGGGGAHLQSQHRGGPLQIQGRCGLRTFQCNQVYTETSLKPNNNEVLLCLRVIDLFLTESFFSIFILCECRCVCASQISLQESLVFIYKVSPGDGTRDVFRGSSKHLTCWALTPALSLFFF